MPQTDEDQDVNSAWDVMNRVAPDVGVARACRVMNIDRSLV